MRDYLVLYINGARHTVRGRDAFLSLSDFLRLRLGLIGTKIVCSEGDCGACTVLIGRTAKRGRESFATGGVAIDGRVASRKRLPTPCSQITYLPVDSCIQFLFQLDGTHAVTVEGLRPDGQLNPVQQAMVDCHGSQCGFCTPGFVMAMTGLREEQDELDAERLRTGLTGNLCRCTGYMPIIEAGLRCNDAEHERLSDLYPPGPMLAEFERLRAEPVTLNAEWFGEPHVAACPTTLDDALDFLAEHPTATIVAGATDIGVRVNKSGRIPAVILDLNRIPDLDDVRIDYNTLIAGARATWTNILNLPPPVPSPRRGGLGRGEEADTSATNRASSQALPEFTRILSTFGAPQIRHVGTIGGNIANASPIADSLPLLYAMEATLVLTSRTGQREVNINDFYLGYKKLDLKPGELITEVRIPLPADDEHLRLYKVTRRRDLDISGFTAAIRVQLSENDVITHASIALGAVGPTVLRPRRTEQFLIGKSLTGETMQAAGDLAVEEITPIDDVRGSANYRRQLTRNVFLKFYCQTQADLAPA
jgi:xanthine dehydrogenase small subunit